MEKKEIIFIHIPKTGGVSVSTALKSAGALKRGYGVCHDIARKIVKKEDRNCIIMGIVRNPYDRLYSLYEFYRKKRSDIDKHITFESFIINFEEKYYLVKDQFNTCYDFLIDRCEGEGEGYEICSAEDPDYIRRKNEMRLAKLLEKRGKLIPTDIIKFENLQSEYDLFCKKYKIKNCLIEMNKNELKNNDICWSELYTEEMQKIVNRIFYKDFETFNYSYSGFLNSKINIQNNDR